MLSEFILFYSEHTFTRLVMCQLILNKYYCHVNRIYIKLENVQYYLLKNLWYLVFFDFYWEGDLDFVAVSKEGYTSANQVSICNAQHVKKFLSGLISLIRGPHVHNKSHKQFATIFWATSFNLFFFNSLLKKKLFFTRIKLGLVGLAAYFLTLNNLSGKIDNIFQLKLGIKL